MWDISQIKIKCVIITIYTTKEIVVYVKRSTGGAARFKETAERKGKKVINIADRFDEIKK